MKDYLMEGVPCAFFNFTGHYELEAKVRKLIKDNLKASDSPSDAYNKTIDIFKQNNIENIIWSYVGTAIFWYIGD